MIIELGKVTEQTKKSSGSAESSPSRAFPV
jgi:hypothetical protein